MGFWNKFSTAIRGHATETGDAIIDSQALTILDQEIRDADNDLRKAKDSLTTVMARRKRSEAKVAELKHNMETYEGHAMKALDNGDEALATEVAERISEIESNLTTEQSLVDEFRSSEKDLKSTIDKTERGIKSLKQQVETVKATEAVQKAQSAVAARHSGADSSARRATDSLKRLQDRQAERKAKMEAAEELYGEDGQDSLDTKLKNAGISGTESSADAVLARLRKKSDQ